MQHTWRLHAFTRWTIWLPGTVPILHAQIIRRLTRRNAIAGVGPHICTPERAACNPGGLTMYSDPIVEEVREAGAKLAEKAGYDIHASFVCFARRNATIKNRL
jgi:hypothetical protein